MIQVYIVLLSIAIYTSLIVGAAGMMHIGFPFEAILYSIMGTVGGAFYVSIEAIRQWRSEKERQYQIPLYEKIFYITLLIALAFMTLKLFELGRTIWVITLIAIQIICSIFVLHRSYAYITIGKELTSAYTKSSKNMESWRHSVIMVFSLYFGVSLCVMGLLKLKFPFWLAIFIPLVMLSTLLYTLLTISIKSEGVQVKSLSVYQKIIYIFVLLLLTPALVILINSGNTIWAITVGIVQFLYAVYVLQHRRM